MKCINASVKQCNHNMMITTSKEEPINVSMFVTSDDLNVIINYPLAKLNVSCGMVCDI